MEEIKYRKQYKVQSLMNHRWKKHPSKKPNALFSLAIPLAQASHYKRNSINSKGYNIYLQLKKAPKEVCQSRAAMIAGIVLVYPIVHNYSFGN
jgi:hypothetical protein